MTLKTRTQSSAAMNVLVNSLTTIVAVGALIAIVAVNLPMLGLLFSSPAPPAPRDARVFSEEEIQLFSSYVVDPIVPGELAWSHTLEEGETVTGLAFRPNTNHLRSATANTYYDYVEDETGVTACDCEPSHMLLQGSECLLKYSGPNKSPDFLGVGKGDLTLARTLPFGSEFLLAVQGSSVGLWDTLSGKRLSSTSTEITGAITCLDASLNNRVVGGSAEGEIFLCELDYSVCSLIFRHPRNLPVVAVALLPSSNPSEVLAVFADGEDLRIMRGDLVTHSIKETGIIRQASLPVQVSSAGRIASVYTTDRTQVVVSDFTGKRLYELSAPGDVSTLALTWDGKCLAAGSKNTVLVWNTP